MPQSTSTACPFAKDHAEGVEWWPDWEEICHVKVAYYSFIRVQEVYTINVQI